MKTFIVIIIFAFVVAFIYVRLKPYIATARRVLGFVRDARRLDVNDPPLNAPRAARRVTEKLVRCATCGTWFPASRALMLGNSANVYCSHDCIERAADPRPAKKVAGNS
jgi:hypothetical protein